MLSKKCRFSYHFQKFHFSGNNTSAFKISVNLAERDRLHSTQTLLTLKYHRVCASRPCYSGTLHTDLQLLKEVDEVSNVKYFISKTDFLDRKSKFIKVSIPGYEGKKNPQFLHFFISFHNLYVVVITVWHQTIVQLNSWCRFYIWNFLGAGVSRVLLMLSDNPYRFGSTIVTRAI